MATETESKLAEEVANSTSTDSDEAAKSQEPQTIRQLSPQFGPNPYCDNPEWWTSESMLIGIHVWLYRISKVDVINVGSLRSYSKKH